MTKEHGFNGNGNGVLSDTNKDDICDVMTIYFNDHEKYVAKESSDYLACQTWVALIHLHIPDIIEDQLDSIQMNKAT